jgi:Domain of unknown function (DUF1824)
MTSTPNMTSQSQDAEALLRGHEDLGAAATMAQRENIRRALQVLTNAADYHIFGVCADSQSVGLDALQAYARHFSYELAETFKQQFSSVNGAVYLKFNPRTQRCFTDVYSGTYRGVLVSFQSDSESGYSGTHGHFPLDLFEKD